MTQDCNKDGCAACMLAERTGRPHIDFEGNGYKIPDFREQKIKSDE